MDEIVGKVEGILNAITDRLRNAININLTQTQLTRMVVIVILYVSVVRPWMVKLAEKEGDKQLSAMEQRDKDKKEQEAQESAVNMLRSGKKPTAEDESQDSKVGVDGVSSNNSRAQQKARQRTVRDTEAKVETAEDIRARNLENWDEDQDFLRNFSQTSDRSYA